MSHKKLLRGSPRDIVKLFCLVRQLRVMASIKHRVVRDRQNQQELRQCVPPNVTNDRSILCHIHYSTSDGRARSIKISKPNFWHRNQKSLSLIFSSSTEPQQKFLIPAIGFALYWISVKFSSKEHKRKDLKKEADYNQDYKVGGGAADSKRRSFIFFSPCHQLSICRISHEMLRLSVTLYI